MNRVLLTLLAVLTLWCGLATWATIHQRGLNATTKAELAQATASLKAAQAARKRADAALVSAAKKNAATARETAFLARSLAAATASNPDWAAAAVPKEVQDALRGSAP